MIDMSKKEKKEKKEEEKNFVFRCLFFNSPLEGRQSEGLTGWILTLLIFHL